ncbi:putative DNA binding domain-containing protein [Faecalicatena contorta]|uniref:DNA binding domain-containing protein n=1 Tax=Faecalicatena fissicatena TaxID=290055 RepID=A0ABS2EAZ3_9FIRM|nr:MULTISPECIES: RNA-binding domain-containing protein [Clostridia]MBM6686837.1 putative DNA binding domain-containing protein [Faecalicatena contorta]MBM6712064.1 putative DNA binding domain-containing protein [Faecalicatena contorta]MBM6738737.1 putative DNA binding domain-containing protein [Faecalicatena fissicatena]
MIYTDIQLKEKIIQMIESFESEVVEFKEAKTNYSFNDIGKYFSALSNEANIRGFQEAWLVFGISNDKKFTGTEFRKQGGLQSLKKELVNGTNERLTFLEIYELSMHKCRIIAFQIPPAIRGIPTTWQGAAYAREHESLCPLPMNKVDLIRSQIGMDWSKEIVKEASVEDLDPVAVKKARELFSKRQSDRGKAQEILSKLSDVEVLNKAGITIKGKITRTALLLLGKSESAYFFDGFIPRITWTLYNADNSVKAYEHFDMPMLLAVDKVYNKIRNEKYRYIAGQQTLFPDEVNQYEPELIKEIINNCIAHQDYRMRGKINVEEFEDKLVFINEGAFIPETIETALEPGYKPPYYRNVFLCNAMVNLYMIDTNSMGIPMMYQIQRDKCFPLPTYDLSIANRVRVTVYGKILDKNYTQLLHADTELNMRMVFLLDKVQKKEVISKESFKLLKRQGLVEGRYPNIFVSFKVADIVGQKAAYIRNRGLEDDICKQLIVKALEAMGEASKREIMEVLENALPEVLDEGQKSKKVSNLLQAMKKEGLVAAEGKTRHAKWILQQKE